MSEFWRDHAGAWRAGFAQPEVDSLLDKHMTVLLDNSTSTEGLIAARASINTIIELERVPALAATYGTRTPPKTEPAQAWRQRLLSIVRRIEALRKETVHGT